MLRVHLEPESVQKEFPREVERCHFCHNPTRYWAEDRHTPVCLDCARPCASGESLRA